MVAVALLARVAPHRRLSLSAGALTLLARHPFPGNVRELRNVLERASLLADGATIEPLHVECALGTDMPSSGHRALAAAPANASPAPAEGATLRSVERAALQAQLKAHRGSRAELARKLGISERSLYRKLRDIDLEPPD